MEFESMANVLEEVSGEAVSEVVSEAVSKVVAESSGFFGTFFTDFANDFVAFFSNLGEIDTEAVMEVLKVMGLGMVGIFGVTGIIILFVSLLNNITSLVGNCFTAVILLFKNFNSIIIAFICMNIYKSST